jgi:hypothetical protein
MGTGFDPYHRWLSIPPSEQPPNHYRLLGLQVYESSVEVIENAALRQSRHVRPHLDSPLRPYATNLLRELEVARLCLLDPEAKAAYDDCLTDILRRQQNFASELSTSDSRRLRSGSTERLESEAASSANSYSGAFESPSPQPSGLPDFTQPVVTPRYRRRQRRKTNPIAFLLFWFAGGAIGLLCGYALLCMLDPKYDFLHVMFDDAQAELNVASGGVPAATANSDRRRAPQSAEPRKRRPSISPGHHNAGSTDKSKSIGNTLLSDGSNGEQLKLGEPPLKDDNQAEPVVELKPLTVPFDLKKRVIRVVTDSNQLPADLLRCSIDGSPELAMEPLVDLSLGDKRDMLFKVGLGDAIVGAEVEFLQRNNLLVVEIRPKFRLPSGDEEAFYKRAGLTKGRTLSNRVAEARTARNAIPALQRNLQNTQSKYQAALQTANSVTTANGYMTVTAAQRAVAELYARGAALEDQIRKAESLASNLPGLESDLAAVQQVGTWGAEIAKSATLSVSICHDGVSLTAQAR